MPATDVVIVVDGKTVTPFARVGRVRIDDLLNDAPNTAALTMVAEPRYAPLGLGAAFDPGAFDAGGFATTSTGGSGAFAADAFNPTAFATAPTHTALIPPPPILAGASIAVYLGAIDPATQIFGGQITVREQYAELDIPAHVRYDLSCVDWSRRLSHRTVTIEYHTASVTTIVNDLIARFAPRITTNHVQAGLPSISGMTFTFEDVAGALSRLASTIGAYWYVDYVADVHFYLGTEAGPAPAPLVPGGRFSGLKISQDLTQIRTRVIVEGDGGAAAASLGAADALIPLSTSQPFNAAGGRAKIGTTLVTYTGTLPGGSRRTRSRSFRPRSRRPRRRPRSRRSRPSIRSRRRRAPGAPTAALAPASTAGALTGGPYRYAVTLELTDGRRSDIGAPSASLTITPAPAAPATAAALFAHARRRARSPSASPRAMRPRLSMRSAARRPRRRAGPSLTGRGRRGPRGVGRDRPWSRRAAGCKSDPIFTPCRTSRLTGKRSRSKAFACKF